jgi:hypothetical protein
VLDVKIAQVVGAALYSRDMTRGQRWMGHVANPRRDARSQVLRNGLTLPGRVDHVQVIDGREEFFVACMKAVGP